MPYPRNSWHSRIKRKYLNLTTTITKPERIDCYPSNNNRSESMKLLISQPINISGDFQGFADAFLEDICGYYTPFIQVNFYLILCKLCLLYLNQILSFSSNIRDCPKKSFSKFWGHIYNNFLRQILRIFVTLKQI